MYRSIILGIGAAALVAGAASAADPIKLRLGQSVSPRAHINVQIFAPWTKKVTAESKGTVDLELFAGGKLGGNKQSYDVVKSGVADIMYMPTAYFPAKFPKSSVVGIPFNVEKSIYGSQALWAMYKNGILADEYKEFRIVALFCYPEMQIHSSFPVHKLEDIQGIKFGATSKVGTEILAALGAIPVSLSFPKVYQAMNRGLTKGELVQWTGMQPLRLWEVAKYHTEIRLGGSSTVLIAMNKGSYAKLPAAGKAAIDANSGEAFTKKLGVFWDHVNVTGRELVAKQKDNKIFGMPEAEKKRWYAKIKGIEAEWVKSVPDGAKVLKVYREEHDKAKKASM